MNILIYSQYSDCMFTQIQEILNEQEINKDVHYEIYDDINSLNENILSYCFDFIFIETNECVKQILLMIQESHPYASTYFLTENKDNIPYAFSFHIPHFALLPIDIHEFKENVIHMIERYRHRIIKFFINTRQGSLLLNSKDIIYIESCYHTLYIHTTHGTYSCNQKKKKEIMNHLSYSTFIKVERSFDINLDHIRVITPQSITLSSLDIIPISSRLKSKTMRLYHQYRNK